MRFLIFGVPRSGTTSLYHAIVEQISEGENEPFTTDKWVGIYYNLSKLDLESKIKTKKNFCLKSLAHQFPKFLPQKTPPNPKSICDNFNYLSKLFDKVILLDRRNEDEHLESFFNLINKIEIRNKKGRHHAAWGFESWYGDEITEKVKNTLIENGFKELLLLLKKSIKNISEKNNIPITYYEDLYSANKDIRTKEIEKLELGLNTNLILKHTHPKHKLRLGDSKPIL